ncbi:MAG: hypothetical protein ACK576_07005 [Cyclobacteriaceae bacterium]
MRATLVKIPTYSVNQLTDLLPRKM